MIFIGINSTIDILFGPGLNCDGGWIRALCRTSQLALKIDIILVVCDTDRVKYRVV
jgi:hypothetical protein